MAYKGAAGPVRMSGQDIEIKGIFMFKKLFFILAAFGLAACTSTYRHSEFQIPAAKLNPSKGVIIVVPDDGWYGSIHYKNSGRMTAHAVRAAFAKHASRTVLVSDCAGTECMAQADIARFGYFVKPVILHWEDRATEWSVKPDRIEIQLVIYDAVTLTEIASASYMGKSKLATLGGDHPQDMLSEPTDKYVSSLYK